MDNACNQIDSTLAANGFKNALPSARQRIIVDKVSQSRGQPGYQVTVNTDKLAAYVKDFAGRTGHLIGIRLVSSVEIAGATVTVEETGHALRGCIYNVRLQGQDGHVYWRDLSGRDLVFDNWARNGHIINSPPLAADWNPAQANPFTPGANLYPFPATDGVFGLGAAAAGFGATRYRDITLDCSLIGRHGIAGLIPLADIINNNGQLMFNLAETTPFGGSAIAAFKVQGQTQTAVRVEFDVLYADGIMTSRRWILDDYTMTVADGPFKYPGFRHSYIAWRWREEDIGNTDGAYGALTNADNLDNVKVTIGSTAEVSGLLATEMRDRLRWILEQYPDGEINTFDRQSALPAFVALPTASGNPLANGQPSTGVDYLTRLCDFAVPYAQRAANRPTGAVSYDVAANSVPSGGVLRVIHRVEGKLSEAPIESARACGCRAEGKPTLISDDKGNELLTTKARK